MPNLDSKRQREGVLAWPDYLHCCPPSELLTDISLFPPPHCTFYRTRMTLDEILTLSNNTEGQLLPCRAGAEHFSSLFLFVSLTVQTWLGFSYGTILSG